MFQRLVRLVISDVAAEDRPAPVVALQIKERTPAQRAALQRAREARWKKSSEAGQEDPKSTATEEKD